MHAFLICDKNQQKIREEASRITENKKAKFFEFTIQKIEDVRSLEKFTNLTLNQPTAIFLNNIESASKEALNAFLKSLEEPQKNLTYILATNNLHKVLPTIVSRCHIVKIGKKEKIIEEIDNSVLEFFKLSIPSQLAQTSQLKTKIEATGFLENLIKAHHSLLTNNTSPNENNSYKKLAKILIIIDKTLQNIRANGNVQIQLTNMVASIA